MSVEDLDLDERRDRAVPEPHAHVASGSPIARRSAGEESKERVTVSSMIA